jgi:ATP-binding cassette subfamily B (MDR/TAP) protein 1
LRTAGDLSYHIRNLTFRSILLHDISYFDEKEHSTGVLTSGLSENAEKISGLAGITLGSIIQSVITIIGGSIVGLCYGWKLALVGVACIPLVISSGYAVMKIVIMKDKTNRKAHEESAQLACEAAAAIKTVASLTREDDCLRLYSQSLDKPLRVANHSAFVSSFWFSVSQAMVFFVIALVCALGSLSGRLPLSELIGRIVDLLVRLSTCSLAGVQHCDLLCLLDGA